MMLIRIAAAVAAISTVVMVSLSAVATPASAQVYSGRIVCEARSPSAVGYGVSSNRNVACHRALFECSIRTPVHQTCFVSRSFYETI
jgi:hypothetical protein